MRTQARQIALTDYFSMEQSDRVQYLNYRKRAGELSWSNNVRDLLCSVGVEDFVLLIGGPKRPEAGEGSFVLSWRGAKNWSADIKHEPCWIPMRRTSVMRRIIKLGGQRGKEAMSGFKKCDCGNHMMALKTIHSDVIKCECGKELKAKCGTIEEIRVALTKEYLL